MKMSTGRSLYYDTYGSYDFPKISFQTVDTLPYKP